MGRSFEAALSHIIHYGNWIQCLQINYLSAVDETAILECSSPPPLSERIDKSWIQGGGILLHQLVESMASRYPLSTAITFNSLPAITYRELVAKARTKLCQLQQNGLTAQTVVLLLLQGSPQLVIAQLAVLMGGSILNILEPLDGLPVNPAKIGLSRSGMILSIRPLDQLYSL